MRPQEDGMSRRPNTPLRWCQRRPMRAAPTTRTGVSKVKWEVGLPPLPDSNKVLSLCPLQVPPLEWYQRKPGKTSFYKIQSLRTVEKCLSFRQQSFVIPKTRKISNRRQGAGGDRGRQSIDANTKMTEMLVELSSEDFKAAMLKMLQ